MQIKVNVHDWTFGLNVEVEKYSDIYIRILCFVLVIPVEWQD